MSIPPQHGESAGLGGPPTGGGVVTEVWEHATGTPADDNVGRLAATVMRLRREVRDAQAAADGRALIEMAKGILMERLSCDPAQAAQQLAVLAEKAGRPPLEMAADIVDQAARDRLSDVTRAFLDRAAAREPAQPAGEAEAAAVAVRLRTAQSGVLAAHDTQAVVRSLLEHALRPLGASAVAVWAAGRDASLTLAGWGGFSSDEAGRWHYVPPGVATPARRALTERQAVWLPDLAASGLPSIGHRDTPNGGRVAVPAGTGGRVLGVLEICWPGPLEPQPPVIRRQVEALAELCAHTLDTHPVPAGGGPVPAPPDPGIAELVDLADGLRDSALVLLPHLDADGRLTDFRVHHTNARFVDPAGRPRSAITGGLFLESYPLAAADGGLFEQLERVYGTGESFRSERVTLTSLVDEVPLTATAEVSVTRHRGGMLLLWHVADEAARLANLLQHAQRLGRIGGFEENTATGDIVWNSQLFDLYGLPPSADPIPVANLAAHAHPDDADTIRSFLRTLLHHRRDASATFRLRRPDGIVRHIRVVAEPVLDGTGRLHAVRGAYQDISAQHWTEVALAATRDQLAGAEEEVAERNRLALQLQHAIMPPARGPIDAAGLHIAVRYRPAEQGHLVGGDWYDVAVLPSGDVFLCVGDVAGHGIDAATGMVVLRNALRGLAATGAGPAQLLGWLNVVAHHLTDHVTATAICGLYNPQTRVLRWARAGHLPPVLIRGRDTIALPLLRGLLLGALPAGEYEEGEVALARGDTLLMYTDGLIERRRDSVELSVQQLLETVQTAATGLEERLDHLLGNSVADTEDDTCLIGVRLP